MTRWRDAEMTAKLVELRLPAIAACGLSVLGAVLEIAYGADPSDVLRYAAYEFGFVIVPGVLAVRALRPGESSMLITFALGWALGYVLEVLFFNLTAAAGVRDLFIAYPILVAGFAIGLRPQAPRSKVNREALSRRTSIALAAVCALAMLYVALPLFSETRLPGLSSIQYTQDYSWAISLAADLTNHWPLADPNVSGEALPYHFFFSAHLAAAGQVTGVELPTLFFRLFVPSMMVCLVLQFATAGLLLFRNAAVGTLAAGLSLFGGQLQLDPRRALIFQIPFLGIFFTLLISSPSFFFGLVIFMPLIALVGEALGTGGRRPGSSALALLGLFMIGASDAKLTILPSLIIALGIYGAWMLWRERRIAPVALIVGGMAVGIDALLYLIQYRGHASGIGLDIGAGIDLVKNMPAVTLLKDGLASLTPSFPGRSALFSVVTFPLGLFGLLAPQLCGLWFVLRRGVALERIEIWLLALLASGLLAFFVLADDGAGNQLYFLFYGLSAGCLLSAEGLRRGLSKRFAGVGAHRLATVAVVIAAAVAVLIATPLALGLQSATDGNPRMYVLWYGGMLVLLAAINVVPRRRAFEGLGLAGSGAALICATLVATSLIGTPAGRVIPAIVDRAPPSSERAGLTPALYDALAWVRENTPTGSVVAVSNPGVFAFDYAAFTERRLFLGGWGYSQLSRDDGYGDVAAGRLNPFADRLALNESAFARADRSALQTLTGDFHVSYLVVDRVNGPQADLEDLSRIGRPVFENADAAVLAVG